MQPNVRNISAVSFTRETISAKFSVRCELDLSHPLAKSVLLAAFTT